MTSRTRCPICDRKMGLGYHECPRQILSAIDAANTRAGDVETFPEDQGLLVRGEGDMEEDE